MGVATLTLTFKDGRPFSWKRTVQAGMARAELHESLLAGNEE